MEPGAFILNNRMKHRLGRRQSQEHDLRGAWPGDTLTILTEQVGQKKGIARVTLSSPSVHMDLWKSSKELLNDSGEFGACMISSWHLFVGKKNFDVCQRIYSEHKRWINTNSVLLSTHAELNVKTSVDELNPQRGIYYWVGRNRSRASHMWRRRRTWFPLSRLISADKLFSGVTCGTRPQYSIGSICAIYPDGPPMENLVRRWLPIQITRLSAVYTLSARSIDLWNKS